MAIETVYFGDRGASGGGTDTVVSVTVNGTINSVYDVSVVYADSDQTDHGVEFKNASGNTAYFRVWVGNISGPWAISGKATISHSGTGGGATSNPPWVSPTSEGCTTNYNPWPCTGFCAAV